MTKRELVDMFKNIIFPKQAEDLLKINYEGLGELDKREFLRDTTILIMLAEKGLKFEQEIIKSYLVPMLGEIDLEMSEQSFGIQTEPWEVAEKLRKEIIQQKINALKSESEDEEADKEDRE